MYPCAPPICKSGWTGQQVFDCNWQLPNGRHPLRYMRLSDCWRPLVLRSAATRVATSQVNRSCCICNWLNVSIWHQRHVLAFRLWCLVCWMHYGKCVSVRLFHLRNYRTEFQKSCREHYNENKVECVSMEDMKQNTEPERDWREV
jgi:hypothetical protein